MKLVLSVLVLLVSLSMAVKPTATGDAIGGTSSWQGSDLETVLWSQLPTGYAHASQYFTVMYPTYDSGVADDFEFTVGTTINKIRWWGGYWGGSTALPINSPVEIYLYFDDGTGNAPTLPQHTAAASFFINPGEYTEVPDGPNYMCEWEYPGGISFGHGHYWIEIRKAFAFDPNGQYGWIGSQPVTLATAVQGFDGLTPPVIWWTPITEWDPPEPCDVAFELIWDDEVPLVRSTWADIKTTF